MSRDLSRSVTETETSEGDGFFLLLLLFFYRVYRGSILVRMQEITLSEMSEGDSTVSLLHYAERDAESNKLLINPALPVSRSPHRPGHTIGKEAV